MGDVAGTAGQIFITVHRARNLRDTQTFGTQDPYVLATVFPSETNARSQWSPGGGVEPIWPEDGEEGQAYSNTDIALPIASNTEYLQLELWHHNAYFGHDDRIGGTGGWKRRAR